MTSKKMEDDLKKNKNGRRPQKIKWKTNQTTKINLIGCDTIVNSPSLFLQIKCTGLGVSAVNYGKF